jgi:PTH1 family peptidyl-tRNA hydrolase
MVQKDSNSQQLMIPKLIVGLGNPGSKYEQTRHNIGFEVVDVLARYWQVSWQNNPRFQGMFTETRSPMGDKIFLLKPTTYMNHSGQAVRAVMDWYKLTPESILVIYDDLDLPVGRLRIRLSGSAGGHNGMKSIIAHLNSQKFPRLRVGISKSSPEKETISHVLGRFTLTELPLIQEVLNLAVDAVELSLKQGIEKAMNLYNNRVVEL